MLMYKQINKQTQNIWIEFKYHSVNTKFCFQFDANIKQKYNYNNITNELLAWIATFDKSYNFCYF